MSHTVPAAAPGLPAFTRRGLAAALTITPLAALAAAPAGLLANSELAHAAFVQDGVLLDLERQWRCAVTLAEDEDRKRDEVARRYDVLKPCEPDAIVWREEDREMFGDAVRTYEETRGDPNSRRFFDGQRTIETLEGVLAELKKLDYPTAASAKVKRGTARIQEILSAHAAWRQEVRACWHSSGMHAAERAYEAADDRVADLRRRIAATPAASLAGIMVKARIGSNCFGSTVGEVDSTVRDLMEEDELAGGETIAFSILGDLARLAAAGGALGGANA